MTGDDNDREKDGDGNGDGRVVRFPFSRVIPGDRTRPFRDLGQSRLSQALGMTADQLSGHWCSHCEGIWFGTLSEVECAACGKRGG
jgi:hypothetical protein